MMITTIVGNIIALSLVVIPLFLPLNSLVSFLLFLLGIVLWALLYSVERYDHAIKEIRRATEQMRIPIEEEDEEDELPRVPVTPRPKTYNLIRRK